MRRVESCILSLALFTIACGGGSIGAPSDEGPDQPLVSDPGDEGQPGSGGAIAGNGAGSGSGVGSGGSGDEGTMTGSDDHSDARDVLDNMPKVTVPETAPARFACDQPELRGQARTTTRRMTRDELLASYEALVGASVMETPNVQAAIASIPEESPGDLVREFQNGYALEHARGMLLTARAVAAAVTTNDAARESLMGACAAEAQSDCASAFLDTTATRILKRPLDATRRASMLQAFEDDGAGMAAMEQLLARLLMSPEVAFHVEQRPQTCQTTQTPTEAPSPLSFAWDDESVFFKPNSADDPIGPQAQLTEPGWYVWQLPGTRIPDAYVELKLELVAISPDDTPLNLQVNVNDVAMMTGLTLEPGEHTLSTSISVAPNQDLKVGVMASNAGGGIVAEYRQIVLEPEEPGTGAVLVEETCTVAPAQGDTVDVDHWSVASRVAFALTGRAPDAELLAAAARGELGTVAQVMPHAERLIETQAARQQFHNVLVSWLGLNAIPTPNELIADSGGVDAAGLTEEARAELLEYVTFMVFDMEADVSELMSAHLGFPRSERMASLYAAPVVQGSEPVELTSGHGGLLLRVAPLLSGQNRASPILRGVYVRKRLLCDDLPSPDFTIVEAREEAVAESNPATMTTREIMAEITSPDACMACHTMINPLGFALERFGPLGVPREVEVAYDALGNQVAEHPIDTTVMMPAIETGGPESLEGPEDLNQALAASGKVRSCVAQRLYSQAHLRPVGDADMCVLADVEQTLRDGGTIKEAWLQAVVNADLFSSKAEVSQ